MDAGLVAKLLGPASAVCALVADGALIKACEYLRAEHMPNVRLIIRDPSHFVRIAVKEPLVRTGNFAAHHPVFVEDRHALLKDLQNSRLWQARLEACQSLIVRAGPAVSRGES